MLPTQHISLSGIWDFRLDEEPTWRPIPVPGCWEALGVHKDRSGPAWYRARFVVPSEWIGRRIWLHFGAVSYHCAITVNGRAVGEHTGLWDAFAVEISDAVAPGEAAELLVRVEKPAGMERGPASASLPGAFPLRETLTGFLPYVWGQIFGGIWQDVTLVASGRAVFEDVHARGAADGRVIVDATLSGPGIVALALLDPNGEVIFEASATGERRVSFETIVPDPRPWSPADPALYTARLLLADLGLPSDKITNRGDQGDERTIRFGLRSLDVDGTTIQLNGRPIYPRMALSWGWYPDALHSNPGPERVRADLERLKSLGYNGVKLCLWFPPQYYFDLADELGMLLWVELPMWLPNPTEFFRRQTPIEYERLVRLARNHPAVILYSLGCELNRAVGADILGPLFALVKALAGDALVRDNSGSGEAYGGLLNEHAEYYDYHFYSDLQFFRDLIDYFSPRWRPEMPWLFGEFCDSDTFRDLSRLDDGRRTTDDGRRWLSIFRPSSSVLRPWWTLHDSEVNPQGARWQYEVVHQEARLRENGFWERGAELARISERQALIYRKHVLELVRAYREIGGYVVTGERDTPISTPGMWDEQDRLKFDPAKFRRFNADLVLLAGWDKRRAWIGGGDRAGRWDTFSYRSGTLVRPHLIASHYGSSEGRPQVDWTVALDGEAPFAAGAATAPFALAPGSLREVAVAEWVAPEVAAPRHATLRASIQIGDERAENAWPLWFFPRADWGGLDDVALVDPTGRLRDIREIAPELLSIDSTDLIPDNRPTPSNQRDLESSSVGRRPSIVITTAWTTEVAVFVERGGAAVLLQSGHGQPGPAPVVEMPFWREAIRIAEPYPAWRDFPCDDVGMQFYGCATDHALDTAALAGANPILRRLDARTMRIHDYAAEIAWGRGRAIISTLRFEGGAGDQPLGISRSTAAAYLLWCWVRYLRDRGA
jgi:hypothetical protein